MSKNSKGRRICIVGFASSSKDWALEQPDDVEVWALNEIHKNIPDGRASRWFQIHPKNWKEVERIKHWEETNDDPYPESHKDTYGRGPEHVEWLIKCNVPIYMNHVDERFPTALQYPLEEITDKFGDLGWFVSGYDDVVTPYLTSSPAFMFALALYEHVNGDTVREIRVAGVDLAVGTEYFNQRPCLEYLMGIAKGIGIKVTPPPHPFSSPLMRAPVYSIDEELPKPADWSGETYNVYLGYAPEDLPLVESVEV